jgi:uncharacterized protein YukE
MLLYHLTEENKMENLVEALDSIAEAINDSVVDEYHNTKASSHLFNIAYNLEEIANTLKKIEAKMK